MASPNISSVTVNEANLKDKLYQFLVERGLLTEVKQTFNFYIQKLADENRLRQKFSDPFVVIFNLRFGDISDGKLKYSWNIYEPNFISFLAEQILYLLTKEPNSFKKVLESLIQLIVIHFFKELDSPATVKLEQIHCDIRFYDLPQIPSYNFSLKSTHVNASLTTINCIIYSKCPVAQYM